MRRITQRGSERDENAGFFSHMEMNIHEPWYLLVCFFGYPTLGEVSRPSEVTEPLVEGRVQR